MKVSKETVQTIASNAGFVYVRNNLEGGYGIEPPDNAYDLTELLQRFAEQVRNQYELAGLQKARTICSRLCKKEDDLAAKCYLAILKQEQQMSEEF